MNCQKWTPAEDAIITQFYEIEKKEFIQALLVNRTWDAIRVRAVSKGLSRTKIGQHKTNINRLLNNEFESYYWLGFLLADGHFQNVEPFLYI